ncbi:hypothetical protein KOR42_02610 [Thalassoglobus neptunius]|uniref:Uncharacterized protein n=1 Tax=Thalassoglobus neptunius TaxID=1938619 RepID=A0A5C5X1W2_9PLAN|nr:hypothetical protein KOR42_02610 [Thalassoglobus neptunius]
MGEAVEAKHSACVVEKLEAEEADSKAAEIENHWNSSFLTPRQIDPPAQRNYPANILKNIALSLTPSTDRNFTLCFADRTTTQIAIGPRDQQRPGPLRTSNNYSQNSDSVGSTKP